MNKPVLIGLILALAFGPGVYLRFHQTVIVADDTAASLPVSDNLKYAIISQELEQGGIETNIPAADHQNRLAFWVLMIVFMLAVSLFLLFEIKKRKAIASQLTQLRSELLKLFHNAPCGFHSLDEGGFFLNVNNTLLGWLGYEREEVVGKLKFSQVVEGGDEVTTQKLSALNETGSSNVKIKLIKKTGARMPVLLDVVNIDGSDQAKRLYCTIDHTEWHQAAEMISNLDQELEAFSYSISHDLRAPLRSIDGYSRILQEDYAEKMDAEGTRVLNVIMSNAKRMGKLIDDLLEFGRLGRKNLQRAHVDMTGTVNSIVSELHAQEPARRIEVRVGSLHTGYGDADMIRQLWFNLLDNAFKYTSKKEIAIVDIRSYETPEKEICYEVSDNGVGFDMKYAPKLFGVFQRLHKIQDFSGTGVGLAMVKRIVARHGGRAWAEGSLTDGAKFYFSIPME